MGIPDSYLRLRDRIREYATTNFDFTFIDTPPNWGYFVLASLHAADCVIVPLLCSSRFSMEGLARALSLIEGVRERANPDLRLLRLIVNNVDKRTAISRVVTDKLLGRLFDESMLFKTSIPTNTEFSKAEMEVAKVSSAVAQRRCEITIAISPPNFSFHLRPSLRETAMSADTPRSSATQKTHDRVRRPGRCPGQSQGPGRSGR